MGLQVRFDSLRESLASFNTLAGYLCIVSQSIVQFVVGDLTVCESILFLLLCSLNPRDCDKPLMVVGFPAIFWRIFRASRLTGVFYVRYVTTVIAFLQILGMIPLGKECPQSRFQLCGRFYFSHPPKQLLRTLLQWLKKHGRTRTFWKSRRRFCWLYSHLCVLIQQLQSQEKLTQPTSTS